MELGVLQHRQETPLRELLADLFVSVDGFAAAADGGQSWTFSHFGPEFGAFAQNILEEPQVMVMGRLTYEIMANAWPRSAGPFAEAMNKHPKLVLSKTLAEPLSWDNARLIKDGLAGLAVAKQQLGDRLRTIGSLSLVRQLVDARLVDHLRLVVLPEVLGPSGQEPVFAGFPPTRLALVSSSVLDSNVQVLEYRPSYERA
jgi:dihydrofolate reductase